MICSNLTFFNDKRVIFKKKKKKKKGGGYALFRNLTIIGHVNGWP